MTVILPDFNLQTRPKMRTRFAISSSTDTNKRILLMTWSWLSREIGTIYRPDSKWGPDLASQVLQALFTLPDVLGWQKNFINDVILNFTRPGWNLQTVTKRGPNVMFQASRGAKDQIRWASSIYNTYWYF